METTTSKLNDLRLIAQEKKKELLFEREKMNKAEDEVSMLKGTVESLSCRMFEIGKWLAEADGGLGGS